MRFYYENALTATVNFIRFLAKNHGFTRQSRTLKLNPSTLLPMRALKVIVPLMNSYALLLTVLVSQISSAP